MSNSNTKGNKSFDFLAFLLVVAAIIFCVWLFLKCQPHYMEIGDGSGLVEISK